MKKLYENIEDIYIIGSASELTEMVTAMDNSLQIIADYSRQLTERFLKYSTTTKGKQFQNTVNTAMKLRDEVYDASMDLNEMQNQIVKYQNKINRYEDVTDFIAAPNYFEVTKTTVSPDVAEIRMTRTEMMSLVSMMEEYHAEVSSQLRFINEKKDDIGNIWRDSQYTDFAEFIEEISDKLQQGLKIYDDFVLYLKERILELD